MDESTDSLHIKDADLDKLCIAIVNISEFPFFLFLSLLFRLPYMLHFPTSTSTSLSSPQISSCSASLTEWRAPGESKGRGRAGERMSVTRHQRSGFEPACAMVLHIDIDIIYKNTCYHICMHTEIKQIEKLYSKTI